MKVQLNEEGYFTGNYAIIGDIENSIEVDGLPNIEEDKQTSCKLVDGEWIFDEAKYMQQKQEAEQEAEIHRKETRILELQRDLSSTDYKIIKCSECQILGEELPYNIAELHEERQALRDEINAIQEELA